MHLLDRVDERGVGLEAERRDETRGAQHPQRVVLERDLRCERRPQPTRDQVDAAVERIDELRPPARRMSSSAIAIALTVKSRRERSVSMSSENVTSGLRLSGR